MVDHADDMNYVGGRPIVRVVLAFFMIMIIASHACAASQEKTIDGLRAIQEHIDEAILVQQGDPDLSTVGQLRKIQSEIDSAIGRLESEQQRNASVFKLRSVSYDIASLGYRDSNDFAVRFTDSIEELSPSAQTRILDVDDERLTTKVVEAVAIRNKNVMVMEAMSAQANVADKNENVKVLLGQAETNAFEKAVSDMDSKFIKKIDDLAATSTVNGRSMLKKQLSGYIKLKQDGRQQARLSESVDKGDIITEQAMELLDGDDDIDEIIQRLAEI